MDWAGWRVWWVFLALLAVAAAGAAWRLLRHDDATARSAGAADATDVVALLRAAAGAPGPWLVGAVFACDAAQWLTVIGFLPTMQAEAEAEAEAEAAGASAGALTALVALVNDGRPAVAARLAALPAAASGLWRDGTRAWVAFGLQDQAPALLRQGALLLFSAVGGLIPATLFTCAVRVAPAPRCRWSSA